MKIYLVGGAVRDQILGKKIKDRDFIVVGGKPEDLLSKGYVNVGKHFPVFIDPATKEEYALARKEKKIAPGHDGFQFEFGPEISLEEDLLRRDFTVNAMAVDGEKIVDPYGGQEDLKKKVLRHVSDHFSEDPLRVIRGFRFACNLGFKIAPETKKLMKSMIDSGELKTLSPERVLMELKKVLERGNPRVFFELCEEFDLTDFVFPSLVPKEVDWSIFKNFDFEEKFCLLYSYTSQRDLYFEHYIVPKGLKKKALLLKDLTPGLRTQFEKTPVLILDFYKRIRMDEEALVELLNMVKVLHRNFSHERYYLVLLDELKRLDFSKTKDANEIHIMQLDLIKSYI